MPGLRPWEEYVSSIPLTCLIGNLEKNTLTSIRTRDSASLGHLSSGLGGLSQCSQKRVIHTYCDHLDCAL